MLREVGADRVLVGHSERRHMFREQEEWMALKLRAALNNDLQPVFCVGESFDDRKVSRTERFVKKQLESGFRLVKADDLHRITIAYEPVWAIGTGETATTKQVDDVHLVIRKWLHTKYGEEAETVRIIYGGSVSPDNAKQLMALDSVDGLLVGGASLQAETFLPIIEYGA
jgi:triosephosphate isomerase